MSGWKGGGVWGSYIPDTTLKGCAILKYLYILFANYTHAATVKCMFSINYGSICASIIYKKHVYTAHVQVKFTFGVTSGVVRSISSACRIIRETVDSVCRDGTDTTYTQYKIKVFKSLQKITFKLS